MGVIQNTITLQNEMSAELEKIKKDIEDIVTATQSVETAFDKVYENLEFINIYFDEMSDKLSSVKDITGLVDEEFAKVADTISENVGMKISEVNEKLIETKEDILASAEAASQMDNNLGGISKSTTNVTKGLNQITKSSAGILKQFGLMPKELSQAMNAVQGLTMGISAAVPAASSLTAALGPISLIATGVMAVVSAVQMFTKEVDEIEEKAIPDFKEMVSHSEELTKESDKLSKKFVENIELINKLNKVGNDNTLIERLKEENELINEQTLAFEGRAALSMQTAIEDALEKSESLFKAKNQETYQYVDGFTAFFRKLTFQPEYDIIYTQTQSAMEEFDKYMGIIESGGELTRKQRNEIDKTVNSMVELTNQLRMDTTPASLEYAEIFDENIKRFGIGTKQLAELTETTSIYSEALEIVNRIEKEFAEQQKMLEATNKIYIQTQKNITREFKDTFDAAEKIESAYNAMSDALDSLNSGANINLDAYNQIMNLSPQYLQYLFDENGALVDLQTAQENVTQAQTAALGVQQAMQVLDAAQKWIDETGSLIGYKTAVMSATDSVWDLVDAQMAALSTSSAYARQGGWEATGIEDQINRIKQLTESAMAGVSGKAGSLERPKVNADGSLKVSDVSNKEIKGEMIRLMEDVTRSQYVGGAYQQRQGITVNMGGYTYNPNVSTTELSASERANIVREGAQTGAMLVSEQIMDAFAHDLG